MKFLGRRANRPSAHDQLIAFVLALGGTDPLEHGEDRARLFNPTPEHRSWGLLVSHDGNVVGMTLAQPR